MNNNQKSKTADKLTRKTWMVSPLHIRAIEKESHRTKYSESELVRRALDAFFFKKRRSVDYSEPPKAKPVVPVKSSGDPNEP